MGPLLRTRSEVLLEVYRPTLQAAAAEAAVEEIEELENSDESVEDSPTPTPTPTAADLRPETDTFAILEERPRPDTVTSLMRIDDDPTPVVRNLLAQLSVLVPDAGIVLDDLSQYCESTERRITSCSMSVEGTTPGGRPLAIDLDVDPGSYATRTSNAASDNRPVMVLTIAYVGEPLEGQSNRESEELASPPDLEELPEQSDLIWPAMDEEAPIDGELIGGWVAPEDATVLLTGSRPEFAVLFTALRGDGAAVATDYLHFMAPDQPVSRDVVADLTEVHKSNIVTSNDGSQARAIHVVSARGNYTFVFRDPPL